MRWDNRSRYARRVGASHTCSGWLPRMVARWEGTGFCVFAVQGGRRRTVYRSCGRRPSNTDYVRSDLYPSWSPDGQRIAFFRCCRVGLDLDLYVVILPSRAVRRLATTSADLNFELVGGSPSWSPDSREVAFASCVIVTSKSDSRTQETVCHLAAAPADAHGSRPIGPPESTSGEWSRDRREIAVTPRGIIVGNRGHRTLGVPEALSAHWSPDGAHLAVETLSSLRILDGRARELRRIAVKAVGTDSFRWSPDGREIAIANGRALVVVDLRNSRVQTVLAEPATTPQWQPRSHR
jgi:Tol biopolymer transport system component